MKLEKKTIILYLVGTFLLSYISWGIIIISNLFGKLAYGTPVSMVLYLIGGFSPTIVSCIVLIRQKEVSGFKQIVKDSFRIRQKPAVYGLMIILSVIPFILPLVIGNYILMAPFYMVFLMIPAMMFGGGLEEVGWRYVLQPFMEKNLSFPLATLITAVIWICWHIPLFLISGTSQNLYMSLPVFAVDIVGTAFALALIRKMSNGIWMCILFHSLHNALGGVIGIKENIWVSLAIAVLMVAITLICHRQFMKRTAYQKP